MAAVFRSHTVSVSVEAPPERVAGFVADPANLPKWATAFCRSVRQSEADGGEWIIETPDGPMTIQFVEPNEFGVLDHVVRSAPGIEILNPMRVVPNGSGSEVLFTLFQASGVLEGKFAEDMASVERDLRTLKGVLEGQT